MFAGRKDDRLAARLRTLKTSAASAPPSAPRASTDLRCAPRHSVYRFARVVLANGVACNCIIRDLNAQGARVVLEGVMALPDVVTLKIDQTGENRKARVAWRRENEAGLAF